MTYEYKCPNQKCSEHGKVKEVLYGIKESPDVRCVECKGKMMRVWSSPTIKTGDGTKQGRL